MQHIEKTGKIASNGLVGSREDALRMIVGDAKPRNFLHKNKWLSDEPVPTRVRAGVAV